MLVVSSDFFIERLVFFVDIDLEEKQSDEK